MAWTNRVIFPGFIMWATVLWIFGCLASLDGPLVTNSLFSQTCLSQFLLGVAWAHTCNPCLSWYHDSSWQQAWITETETLLSDSKVLTLPGGFEPATPKSLAWPRATRLSGQLPISWLLQSLHKHKNNKLLQGGGFFGVAARGQLRETGSTSATSTRATNPRQHWPKDLSKPRRDIHLVEIKYCEDTRPQNQLNPAKEQHKDLCNILQGASVTLHIILLGVGGIIHNTHTLKPFKELGLDCQRVGKLAPSSMCTLWTSLLTLSIPCQTCPFQYCYQPLSGAGFRQSLQPSWSPLTFPFLFVVEELYGTQYQSGSFFLIDVGSGVYCLLHSYFFFTTLLSENHVKPDSPFADGPDQTNEVLKGELGFSEEKLKALRDCGAI